ncbi:MAG: DUF3016 domain-containing protein [Pseudomonadales bacterium]|jgi:hypothetical protein|nr:DUF3016 domain-containing protein [Pseudomonadales bacterium]
MKRLTLASLVTALTLATAASLAHAATVEIDWQNPERYLDMRATNEGQDRFRERTMAELAQTFRAAAAALPANQTLRLTVTDVDLAGEIEYFHPNYPFGIRVMRRVDAPSLDLKFELRDANDRVLQSGAARMHDRSYNLRTLIPVDRSPLRYEKNMIRTWMRETFQSNNS